VVEPPAQIVEAGPAVARRKLHRLVLEQPRHAAAPAGTAAAAAAQAAPAEGGPGRQARNHVSDFAQALLVLVEDGYHWDAALLRQLPLLHAPKNGTGVHTNQEARTQVHQVEIRYL
jgi:hypothetical protein